MPKRPILRVLINDYAGHPFQIDLSRELARRGHLVTHLYCDTNVTPRADLSAHTSGLKVKALSTGASFEKYDVRKRLWSELLYGWKSAVECLRARPDVVLASNMPIVSFLLMRLTLLVTRVRTVLWLQDLQAGLAALAIGRRNHPVVRMLSALEHLAIRSASHVVAISDEFAAGLRLMGVDSARISVIENWAPIAELPARPRRNHWSLDHGLDSGFNFVYSGTLGIKHRPETLTELAAALGATHPEAQVIVVSEGVGADWLAEQRQARDDLDNLRLLRFQPYRNLPDVLGAADILIVLLEPDAAAYSVPSKVLSNLCAGRPVLGLMPRGNAAERTVTDLAGAGLVADNPEGFLDAARTLANDRELRELYGKRAREWAETHFPVDRVADSFEDVLLDSINPKGSER